MCGEGILYENSGVRSQESEVRIEKNVTFSAFSLAFSCFVVTLGIIGVRRIGKSKAGPSLALTAIRMAAGSSGNRGCFNALSGSIVNKQPGWVGRFQRQACQAALALGSRW